MTNFINNTGLSSFNPGDRLDASVINIFNDRINRLINLANNYLNNYCDINLETENFTTKYTLTTAISQSPRRSLGMKIRFLSSTSNKYEEFSYVGNSISDQDWLNIDNWASGDSSIIDGGTWTI